ncbi:MAG: hypothetical protein ISP92_09580 [Pseudomonadales bacterium]|jgi:hypothetical protein|nr:hypothetical protein [Pseudomonadales bacterium]MDA0760573.1 hypothetical protein [Pseudomonadota bacterium]MDA0957665.1 hypothetical protein [Pseudomonadota bacterium]
MKPGTRLKSAVCDAEIMVIKMGESDDLTCGGLPLTTDGAKSDGTGDHMHGCLIGKRYVNAEETVEVLCVKSGEGSLYYAGEELMTKDTKKLPSSD